MTGSTPSASRPLPTRLTDHLGIQHPIVSAPMSSASGGRLAAAVGCGFITWSLARKPELLDEALRRRPAAIMLSFGDLWPFADRVRAAGVPLIAQVQRLDQARHALDVGADIIAAQGGEEGGHGMTARSTFTLVPDVVDLAAERSPETLVLAAGGVVDGRGLAAALALGADGALVGSRFWASREALVSPRAQQRALRASGDDNYRTPGYDVVGGAG